MHSFRNSPCRGSTGRSRRSFSKDCWRCLIGWMVVVAPSSQRDRIVSRTGTHSPASRLQWVSPTVWGYRRPPPPGASAPGGAVALTPEPPRQSLRTCPGGSSGTTFSYLSRAPRSAGAWPWFSVLPCWVHGDRTSCLQPCLHSRGWHQWLRNVLGWANRRVELSDTRFEVCGRCTRLPHGWLRCLHEWEADQAVSHRRHARRANDADITNWQATSYPRVVGPWGSS